MWNESIAYGFEMTQYTLVTNLDGITQEQSLLRPVADSQAWAALGMAGRPDLKGNSINWIAGHILGTRDFFGTRLGIDPFLCEEDQKLYGRGSSSTGLGTECVNLDRLVEGLAKTATRLKEKINTLDQAALEEMLDPEAFPVPVQTPSRGNLLTLCLFHESYHAGQIGTCRHLVTAEGGIE